MLSRVAADGPARSTVMAKTSAHAGARPSSRSPTSFSKRALQRFADGTVTVTDGRARAWPRTLVETERAELRRLIDDWPGSEEPDVDGLLDEILSRLSHEDLPLSGAQR